MDINCGSASDLLIGGNSTGSIIACFSVYCKQTGHQVGGVVFPGSGAWSVIQSHFGCNYGEVYTSVLQHEVVVGDWRDRSVLRFVGNRTMLPQSPSGVHEFYGFALDCLSNVMYQWHGSDQMYLHLWNLTTGELIRSLIAGGLANFANLHLHFIGGKLWANGLARDRKLYLMDVSTNNVVVAGTLQFTDITSLYGFFSLNPSSNRVYISTSFGSPSSTQIRAYSYPSVIFLGNYTLGEKFLYGQFGFDDSTSRIYYYDVLKCRLVSFLSTD